MLNGEAQVNLELCSSQIRSSKKCLHAKKSELFMGLTCSKLK